MGKLSKLQNVYYSMKTRCYNTNSRPYHNYGGRGIIVCSDWLASFSNFKNWAMKNGYREGLTLDRIDVNGNYCPENCRWIPMKAQQNNKRTNIRLTYKGRTLTLSEWADVLGIPYDCLLTRVRRHGRDADRVLGVPDRRKLIEFDGRKQYLSEWCSELGLDYNKTNLRLHRGWSINKAFNN